MESKETPGRYGHVALSFNSKPGKSFREQVEEAGHVQELA